MNSVCVTRSPKGASIASRINHHLAEAKRLQAKMQKEPYTELTRRQTLKKVRDLVSEHAESLNFNFSKARDAEGGSAQFVFRHP